MQWNFSIQKLNSIILFFNYFIKNDNDNNLFKNQLILCLDKHFYLCKCYII